MSGKARSCVLPCPRRVTANLSTDVLEKAFLEGKDLSVPCNFETKSTAAMRMHWSKRQHHTTEQNTTCTSPAHNHLCRDGSGGGFFIPVTLELQDGTYKVTDA
jgi:hypothetical protein